MDNYIGLEILNYVIKAKIGSGGMGSVYLAQNKYIASQRVAVKVISGQGANDWMRRKLVEEAEILTSLNHPNIVKLINYHISDDGTMFLIMEFAEGVTLDKYVREVSGLIPEDAIAPLFEPLLDAIGYAHSKGVLHKDIKPSNIIVSGDGAPKVLDFGIASLLRDETEGDKTIAGTPPYMSPEQFRGESLDERSDVYSLGVLLNYLLIGRKPYDTKFPEDSEGFKYRDLTREELSAILEKPLPRMKHFYPYVSEKIQAVVDKATTPQRGERYSSCEEFKRGLHKAVTPDLWKEYLKKATIPAAALAGLLAFGILWHNIPHSKYYYGYTEKFSVPTGLDKLNSKSRKTVDECYKLTYKRGLLTEMSRINRLGKLCEDGESRYTYSYNGKKVQSRKAYNSAGQCLYVKSYSEDLLVATFQSDDQYHTERAVGDPENPRIAKKLTRHLLSYDKKGYTSSIEYAGIHNKKLSDDNGSYGVRYDRDKDGRVICETFLSHDGSDKSTSWGLGKVRYSYDRKGKIVKISYLTLNDTPSAPEKGESYCSVSYEYGRDGLSSLSYLKEDGTPAVSMSSRFACVKFEYAKDGLQRTINIGADGNTCYDADGVCQRSYTRDKDGYISQVSFLDKDGKPCPNKRGIAAVSYQWDAASGTKSERCLDESGKLVLNSDGYAGTNKKYGQSGLITELSYIGTDGQSCFNHDGHSRIVFIYGEDGNLYQEVYYDGADGKLAKDAKGIAGRQYTWDNGNLKEVLNFDENDSPCIDIEGICKEEYVYDEDGNLKARRLRDASNAILGGFDWEYDERGNITQMLRVGPDENLLRGSLIERYKYDSHDNRTETAYFGADGKPTNCSYGYHKVIMDFNEINLVTSESFFNVNGDPTTHGGDNWATRLISYDEKGNIRQISFTGTDKTPVMCKDGYASCNYSYDALGRITGIKYLGIDGLPVVGRIAEEILSYDPWGNVRSRSFADGSGKVINISALGYAEERTEFDAAGNILEQSFFDAEGKPAVSRAKGYHRIVYTYDKAGNKASEQYFATDGKCQGINGIGRIEYLYTGQNLVQETFFNSSGVKLYSYKYGIINGKRTRKTYNSADMLTANEEWNGSGWARPKPSLSAAIPPYCATLPKTRTLSSGNKLTFNSLTINGNNLSAIFSVNLSKYDEISSQLISEIREAVSAMVREMRSSTGIDTSVKVNCQVRDKTVKEERKLMNDFTL